MAFKKLRSNFIYCSVITLLIFRASSTRSSKLNVVDFEDIIDALQSSGTQQLLNSSRFPRFASERLFAEDTINDLLSKCDQIQPHLPAPTPKRSGDAIKISVSFGMDQICGVDTISETISVAGLLSLSWNVDSCAFDKKTNKTSIGQILVPNTAQVWTPAFRFLQSDVGNVYMQNDNRFGEDFFAYQAISEADNKMRNLSFYWLKDGIYTSLCSLDLKRFPFDEQNCGLAFSFVRSDQLLVFDDPLFDISDLGADDWALKSNDVTITTLVYKGLPTSTVIFGMRIARNPIWYVNNMIIPTAILMLVELASFILPPELPDRPALSTTILLAITVSQSSVMVQVPKTSEHILLADYISALLWLGVICAIYQSAACFLARKHKKAGRNSKKYSRVGGFARLLDIIAACFAIGGYLVIHAYLLAVAYLPM